MAKSKFKLDKLYQDKIDVIQKLLNKHQKLIIKNDSLLNKHIEDFKELVKELTTSRLKSEEQIKLIHTKLDEILNIEVNGTIGLKNVLTIVYEATASHRANIKVTDSIKYWFENHRTIKTIIGSRLFFKR